MLSNEEFMKLHCEIVRQFVRCGKHAPAEPRYPRVSIGRLQTTRGAALPVDSHANSGGEDEVIQAIVFPSQVKPSQYRLSCAGPSSITPAYMLLCEQLRRKTASCRLRFVVKIASVRPQNGA